jgi:Kef-type K+ transport system membrane component KefB
VLDGTFEQIAAVLAVCVFAGVLATLLRQPLIVGLIAAGIAVGPQALGLVGASSEIELLAKIGISLLLFVVGLKLDVRLVRALGPVALATGLGQVAFTSGAGYLIAIALGFSVVQAVYIAVALTFSSTIIIVKLLTEKRELDDLHGRIALGFLIVQDIVVVLAMIAITAVGDTGDAAGGGLLAEFGGVVLRGIGLLLVVGAVGRWVAPRITHLLARQPELLVLAAVAWAVLLAAVTIVLGFSEEVGAFLAGMSLASTPYREALSSRLSTLRDFLLVFFFIDLGTRFELTAATEQIPAALLFSVFVLIGNPIIVLIIMGAMRYPKKVSFKAGLTVAQISEFSLILVALGVAQGHIGDDVVGLVTAVGLITITASTYLIYGSDRIYDRIEPFLRVFERRELRTSLGIDAHLPEVDVIVVGLGRFGRTVLRELADAGDRVLGVDWDPRSVRSADWGAVPVIYGDADDPELAEQLPLEGVQWVISTLRKTDANLTLVGSLRQRGYRGRIVVSTDDEHDEEVLRKAGADLAIRPLHVAASPLMDLLHDHGRRGVGEDH